MKLLLVPILLLVLLMQTFSKCVVLLEYNVNKEYVASKLCENRFRPKLYCNGKCQLAKEMAEKGKNESPRSNKEIKSRFEENNFVQNNFLTGLSCFQTPCIANKTKPSASNVASYTSSVFHPPCA
jgi:hypothetical protein